MDDINFVMLSGVVVGTPDLITTKNGKTICNARIKSVRSFTYNNETKQSSTTKDLKAFGKTGDFISTLRGGDRIRIQGRLATESWVDKNDATKKHYKEIIEVNEATGETANETQTYSAPAPKPEPKQAPKTDSVNDDVPF